MIKIFYKVVLNLLFAKKDSSVVSVQGSAEIIVDSVK
jgi:hypothetical protein